MKQILIILSVCLPFFGFGYAAQANTLDEGDIRSSIIGKRVYLQIPLGGEFPLKYFKDGTVRGDGTAAGVGRVFSPKDQGRWWIKNDQLCQQWEEWYDGKVFCFTVSDLEGKEFTWLRDDGRKGTARLE